MTIQPAAARLVARVLPGALVAALAAVGAALLAIPVRRLPLRVVGIFNEGWNAFAAERALGEGSLYPEFTSLLANNYPPLSYLLIGGLGRLVGDQIVAGRAVALASLVFVAFGVSVLVRRATGSVLLGAFGALLLVSGMALDYAVYVGTNDPQWLAHGFMMAGLLVFPFENRNRGRLVLSVLLLLAGGLVKHSLLPLPAAITLWLLWHDRRSARLWLGAGIAALAAATVWVQLAFGADAFLGIFGSPRRVQAAHALAKLEAWLPPLLPVLLGTVLLVLLDGRNRFSRLLALWVGLALAWGAFTLAGAGVSYNALFDVAIGGALASAVAAARIGERLRTARTEPAFASGLLLLLLCLPVIARSPSLIRTVPSRLATLPAQVALTQTDTEFIAAQAGPALCERPALCYWAGKEYEVDAFNVVERLAAGTLRAETLDELFAARHFGVIHVSNRSPIYLQALPFYEVVREDSGWIFMLPR